MSALGQFVQQLSANLSLLPLLFLGCPHFYLVTTLSLNTIFKQALVVEMHCCKACLGVFSGTIFVAYFKSGFSLWQLYPYTEDAGVLIGSRKQNCLVASLADIAWIDRDEEKDEDYFGSTR